MNKRCLQDCRRAFDIATTLLLALASADAASPARDANGLPTLAPPLSELPPTFWEQHGSILLAVSLLALVVAAVVAVMVLRPKKAVAVPPEIETRRALETLRLRAEDGVVLSRVSQILRRYFIAVFAVPPGEYTTTEFCRALSARGEIGTDLATRVSDFLRACDERKFSAPPQPPLPSAATGALELVERAEARRAQLQQIATGQVGANSTGKP